MPLFFCIAYLLSADLVDYDGKTLTFSNHCHIQHPLGSLRGEKATATNLYLPMNRERPIKRSPQFPVQVQLEKEVTLNVHNVSIPFVISSEKARCELPPKNIFSGLQFQEIEFYENVKITTELEITATGGSAVYKKNQISLSPSLPKSYCRLDRNEDWIRAENILFDLSKMEIVFASPEGYCKEHSLFFSSRSARLTLTKNFQPDFILLEGDVAIQALYQNKPSFALAEKVTYKKEDKELLLSASPETRVLFWQKGIELSAPQLRITDEIEGIGDVHFTLNGEEKNQLLEIFSRHL